MIYPVWKKKNNNKTIKIYIVIEIGKKNNTSGSFLVAFGVLDDLSKFCGNYYKYRKSVLLLENCKK